MEGIGKPHTNKYKEITNNELWRVQIFVKCYVGKIRIHMNNSIMQSPSDSYSKNPLSIRLRHTCGHFPSEFPADLLYAFIIPPPHPHAQSTRNKRTVNFSKTKHNWISPYDQTNTAAVQTFDATLRLSSLRLTFRAVKYCHLEDVLESILLSWSRLRILVCNKMEALRNANLHFSLTIVVKIFSLICEICYYLFIRCLLNDVSSSGYIASNDRMFKE
jgi:hypothetical protein